MIDTLIHVTSGDSIVDPNKIAYTYIDDLGEKYDISYADLITRIQTLAAYLQQHTVKGDRIIIAMPQSIDFVVCYFAVIAAGLIAVPYFPPANEVILKNLIKISDNCHPALIITNKKILSLLRTCNFLNMLPFGKRFVKKMANMESSLIHELNGKSSWCAIEEISKETGFRYVTPDIDKASIAMLQYTSGSTGNPKGVRLPHDVILSQLNILSSTGQCSSNDVSFSWLPVFHDLGLFTAIVLNFYLGSRTIFTSPLSFIKHPTCWLKYISTYQATLSGGPSFAYELVADKTDMNVLEEIDLSSWRLAFCGGEPIQSVIIEKFISKFECAKFNKNAFCPGYGQAESTLILSLSDINKEVNVLMLDAENLKEGRVKIVNGDDNKQITKVVSNGNLKQKTIIVNPDSLSECAKDEIGEIWVQGNSIAEGYYNLEEETKQAFGGKVATHEGSFLRTGDLGFIYDNELYITGRAKDILIKYGHCYYPQDIEYVACQLHSLIRKGCAIAFQLNLEDGAKCVLIAETRHGDNYDDVCNTIHAGIIRLQGLDIDEIVLIKARTLPKTTSGKVQRKKCQQDYTAGHLDVVHKWQKQ